MSEEDRLIDHRACFTGHRPDKLESTEQEVTAELKHAIIKALNDGKQTERLN